MFIHLPERPEKDFWAILSACPIRGEDGRLQGAVMTMTDTSELHRVSEQLKRAVAESEAILSSIPDGLIVNDPDGRIARMNAVAEAMFQYTPEERTLPIWERLPARMQLLRYDGTPYSFEAYPTVRALRGEVTLSEEMIMRSRERSAPDLRLVASAAPILLEDGELLGAVTILTDISDLHQVRALSRRLVELQEHERGYVADQLYNHTAQVLAALKMQLWALDRNLGKQVAGPQLSAMKASLDETIRALHDLASDLRPAGLDRVSLAELLLDYVAQYAKAHGLGFRSDVGDGASRRLPPDVTTAVFRTMQEAIANVAQHAGATQVGLTIRIDGGSLSVDLADNGAGFDLAAATRTGVGLIAMRERVESAGGRLTIESGPGGTTVLIRVPL
jgi:signal transduction histidine kinase